MVIKEEIGQPTITYSFAREVGIAILDGISFASARIKITPVIEGYSIEIKHVSAFIKDHTSKNMQFFTPLARAYNLGNNKTWFIKQEEKRMLSSFPLYKIPEMIINSCS